MLLSFFTLQFQVLIVFLVHLLVLFYPSIEIRVDYFDGKQNVVFLK